MRIPSVSALALLALAGCGEPPGNPAGGGIVPGQAGEPGKPAPLPPIANAPAKPTGTVAERIKQADDAFAAKDYKKAVATLEEAILIDSKDRALLLKLARYGRERARVLLKEKSPEYYPQVRSAGYYLRSLRDNYPEATDEEKALTLDLVYDEATGHATSLRVEETTGALRDLVGYGFKDFARIEKDPDWAGMLALPQFQAEWEKIKGGK